MTRKLFKALKKQKQATEQVALQIYGTLGIPLGGQKLVEVPNRNAFVFVKLRDNQNEVIQAFNNQVATSYGLPVKVQRQGNRYIVLGVDTERYQNMWNSNSPFLPKHGGSHSFNLGGGGGGDVTWVYSQQMMPLLVYPTSTTGAWNANISAHTMLDNNGRWRSVGNTGTISFQPFLPTGASAVMGLIYLDATNGNPGVLIASGSYFPNTITGSLDIYSYIPTPNVATQIPLTAVRLDTGTYNIGWENLYDVRQWVSAMPTGSASSSVSSGTAINIWDEGVFKGVADTLNVVSSVADISISGTVARLFITGSAGSTFSGVDQIGVMLWEDGIPQSTGTVLNFVGGGVSVSVSGTVGRISIPTVSPAYIDGLNVTYSSSGAIVVNPGSAYIPSLGRTTEVTGSISVNILKPSSTVSGTFTHVYLYENASGIPTIQVTGTSPNVPYSGVARTKTGDNSMRYIGSLYHDVGGYLYRFGSEIVGNVMKINWIASQSSTVFEPLSSGTSSTNPTTFSLNHLIPGTGLTSEIHLQPLIIASPGSDTVLAVGETILSSAFPSNFQSAEVYTRFFNPSATTSTAFFQPSSPIKISGNTLQYMTNSVVVGGFAAIRIRGISIQR